MPRKDTAPLIATTATLFIPFTADAVILFKLLTGRFSWAELSVLSGFLVLSLLGTGLGFHRYFAHRTFKANRGLKIFLGILGCTGGIGLISWFAAIHRVHHRHTDSPLDPHTPLQFGSLSLLSRLKNLWMSAFGFSYVYALHGLHLAFPELDAEGATREFRATVRDLTGDPDIRMIDRFYYLWIALFFVLPGLALALYTGKPADFLDGMLWGGVARMGCNQLIFGIINIVGHSHGPQPFDSKDSSRNLYWFAPFSNGESLHNNHHAFPWTAKTCLAWWQLDLNYYFLVLFEKLGWASEVRVPTAEELQAKRRATEVVRAEHASPRPRLRAADH